jgi:short-subunit dehydrogenase
MGELASELGDRGQSLPWDLSQPATLPALWEQATRRFGGVDLLVNCAGFMEIRSFAATPWELGDRLLQVDLVSPLRLMNLAVQGLRAAPRRADRADAAPTAGPCGWIVNISSMAGRVPLRGCSYYGAAKSGLALASQIAGLELRPRGIHVLTVLPGPVYSGLESRARAQVEPGLVSRHVPTGDPRVLAEKIERALRCRRARLVYPTIYALGDRLPGLASALAAALSPEPTDAP